MYYIYSGMKYKKTLAYLAAAVLCLLTGFFSCASFSGTLDVLPLADGWYLYDFERTLVQEEAGPAGAMPAKQEITLKQSGAVTYCENGVLFDPVLSARLRVGPNGEIQSADNPSISGSVRKDGGFSWSGTLKLDGRPCAVSVRGTLAFLPRAARAADSCDGLYHAREAAAGKELLARVSGGLYTWKYLDAEAHGDGLASWSTLLRPDGGFAFSMELTTVLEMEGMDRTSYSTSYSCGGAVRPGKSISLKEHSKDSGGNFSLTRVYSGGPARPGNYAPGALPANIAEELPSRVKIRN